MKSGLTTEDDRALPASRVRDVWRAIPRQNCVVVGLTMKNDSPKTFRKLKLTLCAGLTLNAVACLVFACQSLRAQNASTCKGPAELEDLLAIRPSAQAYDALGAAFAQKGQMACAMSAFQAATRIAPNSWEAHYNLAIALTNTDQLKGAEAELRLAVNLKPDMPGPHAALGMALSQARHPEEAIEQFKLALKTDPKYIPALDGLTKALISERRYSAAINYLKDAPTDEVLQLNLAIAYSVNGMTDQAIQILRAMVKGKPDYARAHMNLATAYTQQKRYQEAAQEYEEALRLDSSDDVARVSYVKALIILAQFDRAKPAIDEYLREKPNEFDSSFLAGVVDRGLADYQEAEPLLRRAVELDPHHYDARYNLGFVLAKLNRLVEAKEQLEKALELNPSSGEARFQLRVLRSEGDQARSLEELKVFQKRTEEGVKEDVT